MSTLSPAEIRRMTLLADVPVELVFEVARFDVPLLNLLHMRNDTVLIAPDGPPDKVQIKLDGKHIATGEVVSSGQRYAVRVLDFLSLDEAMEAEA